MSCKRPDMTECDLFDVCKHSHEYEIMEKKMGNTLNVSEVAELLGVSERSIRREIKEGHLQALRLRKKILVINSDLTEYLKTHKTNPLGGSMAKIQL